MLEKLRGERQRWGVSHRPFLLWIQAVSRRCHLWTPPGKQGFFNLRQCGFAVIYPASRCGVVFSRGP